MRIVVTGFDARSARPAVGEQRLSLGYLIAEGLRIWGHEVQAELCHPFPGSACADFYDDASLIFVGLASPVGLASTYANHALLVLARYWGDPRLRLFVDDPDQSKIIHGARSAVRNKASTDPLLSNKMFRNRYLAGDLSADARELLYEACDRLSWREEWPRTFIPVQTRWCHPDLLAGPSVGIDPTQIAVDCIPWQPPYPRDRRMSWVVEPHLQKRWASRVQTRGMRYALDTRSLQQRYENYRVAVGVLESPPAGSTQVGWWTPAATMAMRTGTFYATDFSRTTMATVSGLTASAYYLLPSAYEDCAWSEQDGIVELQAQELMDSAPEVIDVIKDLMH